MTKLINLKNRTEFSFRQAFGKIQDVLDVNQQESAGICDKGGTWGHVQWQKLCQKNNVKPIFGVSLACVKDMDLREKQGINFVSFLAKNKEGLKELYGLVTIATEKFYYLPRIDYSVLATVSDNLFILSGENPEWDLLPKKNNLFIELSP
jgi:DNA polymerase III alpha subunit